MYGLSGWWARACACACGVRPRWWAVGGRVEGGRRLVLVPPFSRVRARAPPPALFGATATHDQPLKQPSHVTPFTFRTFTGQFPFTGRSRLTNPPLRYFVWSSNIHNQSRTFTCQPDAIRPKRFRPFFVNRRTFRPALDQANVKGRLSGYRRGRDHIQPFSH